MKTFHETNRNRLAETMKTGDVAICFSGEAPRSTADSHYRFKPDKNFFYLTGLTREHFILMMLKQENDVQTVLYIEKPDYDIEKWIGRKMTREQAEEISGITKIEYLEAFKPQFNRWVNEGRIQRIWLDLERMDFDEPANQTLQFARKIRERYPQLIQQSLHSPLSTLRMVKSDHEIDQIRSAIMLTKLGLDEVLRHLKPKLYEYQIASIFSHTIKMNGADGCAFDTIAASGDNAVILHYTENAMKIEKDTLILLDLGAQYKQYASDITRTYPASGRFTPRQKEIYEIVLSANKEVQAIMRPGVSFIDLNNKAKQVILDGLMRIGLVEKEDELQKYYYHSVGHHMGLDTHDLGSKDIVLQPGMVITCEPGLYVAEEGIGIRIEDDILITVDGSENLSAGIPKEIEEIEALMAKK